MESALDPVSPSTLARLHRISIQGPSGILEFLERVQRQDALLSSGINRHNDSRTATIKDLGKSDFTLRFENLPETHLPQLFLSCELEGRRYFFAVVPTACDDQGCVTAQLPHAIYQAERRDLQRLANDRIASEGAVELLSDNGSIYSGVVADSSYHGIGVLLTARDGGVPVGQVRVRFLSGNRMGEQAHGIVRHQSAATGQRGWTKIGLAVSDVPIGQPVEFEKRERILEIGTLTRIQHRASLLRGFAKAVTARAVRGIGLSRGTSSNLQVVQYESAPGEPIHAIADTWGDPRKAIAVVIPPAWGRTKETLSPLAATIVETFRGANQPITVLRFDGTHRRGESFVPSEIRYPGAEYLRFTFSRAVHDIHATLNFLANSPTLRPQKIVLVTLSLAAVEGRRAVATDTTGLLAGWIPVVGMVDLQAALRTISGGIDFAYGLSRGLRFGHHELVGVVADMDHTGLDALNNRLVFLEDARRDMARIQVPITWIHGRHDAWMDVERVRHVMSCGDPSARRVIEVPTGHQLRTSAEAFSVFGLIATEAGRMASGLELAPRLPDLAQVERQQNAERGRLTKNPIALREFWSRYLLGRDARLGFQLLTATSAYRRFMHDQIEALDLQPGARVLDLGSGTGDFAVQLATEHLIADVEVDAVDFVSDALQRASARIGALETGTRVRLNTILLDFDPASSTEWPLDDRKYDAVLASLVISYVSDPRVLLERVRSTLKPGGTLVLSTLRRDADISRLHLEGLAELRAGVAREEFGEDAAGSIDEMARNFLNDASQILDLEEAGTFQFRDLEELAELARRSGFRVSEYFYSFGEPPQAAVLVAHRD